MSSLTVACLQSLLRIIRLQLLTIPFLLFRCSGPHSMSWLTTGQFPVQPNKLLLARVSTVILDIKSRRDPCPYFCSFQDIYMFRDGASSLMRGEVWHSLTDSHSTDSHHSLTEWPTSVQSSPVLMIMELQRCIASAMRKLTWTKQYSFICINKYHVMPTLF
jgi:hypothetical protein